MIGFIPHSLDIRVARDENFIVLHMVEGNTSTRFIHRKYIAARVCYIDVAFGNFLGNILLDCAISV
jgi:hypothetical protein